MEIKAEKNSACLSKFLYKKDEALTFFRIYSNVSGPSAIHIIFKIMIQLFQIAFFALLFLAPSAYAQDLMPRATTADNLVTTHPLIRLTPDKSELIRLDQDAVTVIVGNPAHLNILLDTPRLMVLVPRSPGSTHFTVLDKDGNVIMQRHAIIASPKRNYMRIRRSCANGDKDCAPTSVFFCPDTCYEVQVRDADSSAGISDVPSETAGPGPAETATEVEPDSEATQTGTANQEEETGAVEEE